MQKMPPKRLKGRTIGSMYTIKKACIFVCYVYFCFIFLEEKISKNCEATFYQNSRKNFLWDKTQVLSPAFYYKIATL